MCVELCNKTDNSLQTDMNSQLCRKKLPVTYSGTSRSSLYAKQKALREASKGSARISDYIIPKQLDRDASPSPHHLPDIIPKSLSSDSHTLSLELENVSMDIDNMPKSLPSPVIDTLVLGHNQGQTRDGLLTEGEVTREWDNPAADDEDCGPPSNLFPSEEKVAREWGNPSADDEDVPETEDMHLTMKQLINEAKLFKSFPSLMHLCAVSHFIRLHDEYCKSPKIKNPTMHASYTVARSIGKGPYFARKIRALHRYIARFHTLSPTNSGKHHAHPSLLNNERVLQAVCRHLTVLANGEVSLSQIIYV